MKKNSMIRLLGSSARNAAKGAARLAFRSVGHVVEGEAQRYWKPARSRFIDRGEEIQSRSARKVDQLARRIRRLGNRIQHPREVHFLARQLEETADYLRFRPTERVAGDVLHAARRVHALPILGALVGGFVVYQLLSRNRR